jgi:membrane peptidoglycan carboxypeptidase
MVLEQLKMDLDSNKIFCENGRYSFFKKTISDHKRFGNLTIKEVFENSSNIGTIKLARKFDAPVFYRYARDFGFGTLTGIDLPAESSGLLHKPSEFSKSSACYMSIGYEVAVTPLQIASAYAAIANGGDLLHPYVVRKIVDNEDHLVLTNYPQVIRKVISGQTAQQMRITLQGVVENGTGKAVRIPGINIAGKTGTAQKFDHEKNQYVEKYISSFVGFYPVESPRFVLLITINEPQGEYYGSQVAAPIFRNVVQRIVTLPENSNLASAPTVSSLSDLSPEERELPLSVTSNSGKISGNYKIVKTSNKISTQQIKRESVSKTNSIEKANKNEVPNFIGLTLREALDKLSQYNLEADFEGSGVVDSQFPRPGKRLDSQTKIKLIFKTP